MGKNLFEVFKDEDDYVSWDKYVQQVEMLELSEADKSRARRSLSYLRKLLDDDFLILARQQGNPVFRWYFTDSTPSARLALISFSEALESLEQADKFGELLARIKDARRVEEALTVLDAAYKFLSAGFGVCFDPDVMVPDRDGVMQPKKPDLKLTDAESGEEVFVEVSRLRPGAKQNLTSRTYEVIYNVVHATMRTDPEVWEDILKPRHVLPYVRVVRALDDNELRDIAGKVEEIIRDVIATKEYREHSVENMMEMAVSPSHDHSRAREWAAARKMRDLVEGPRIPVNEINRAKGKIFGELRQLPHDRPGIVLIPAAAGNLLFFMYDVREIIRELADEVSRHPKLLCAVVSHTFSGGGEAEQFTAALGQHIVCSKRGEDMVTEQVVIVHNEKCVMPVSASTATKIRQAFTNGCTI